MKKILNTILLFAALFCINNTFSMKRGLEPNVGLNKKLVDAVRADKYAEVQKLLNQGANANTEEYPGNTVLGRAVINGSLEIVKLLIVYGADVNGYGYFFINHSPLVNAASHGYRDIAIALVSAGAQIDKKECFALDEYGSIDYDADQITYGYVALNAIQLAARNGHLQLAQELNRLANQK